MTKRHILKKKEAKFFKKLHKDFGPITDENALDFPIGNPFRQPSKNDVKQMRKFSQEHRKNNPISDETKEWINKYIEEVRIEQAIQDRKEKRRKVWRLFYKGWKE